MSQIITGNEYLPAMFGGHIHIKKDKKDFYMASIPSLVWNTNLYNKLVENNEEFEDDEGNQFEIYIHSSNEGVNWKLSISSKDGNDKALKNRINTAYQGNYY